MAADCKSAAPWSYGGSNPPLCTRFSMNRLRVALGVYAVLAILAATTIADQKFKLGTLAVLAMFAIRTLTWHRKLDREKRDRQDEE